MTGISLWPRTHGQIFATELHGDWEHVLSGEENGFKIINEKEEKMYNLMKRSS